MTTSCEDLCFSLDSVPKWRHLMGKLAFLIFNFFFLHLPTSSSSLVESTREHVNCAVMSVECIFFFKFQKKKKRKRAKRGRNKHSYGAIFRKGFIYKWWDFIREWRKWTIRKGRVSEWWLIWGLMMESKKWGHCNDSQRHAMWFISNPTASLLSISAQHAAQIFTTQPFSGIHTIQDKFNPVLKFKPSIILRKPLNLQSDGPLPTTPSLIAVTKLTKPDSCIGGKEMAMEEREKQVYLARLAEQAERYDGALSSFPILIIPISLSLNLNV